ncbi:hypothetical protein FRC11_004355 [Ceratobasidium sp. 423]|nr:hypothetical protein FRC11_004355 [Ceratobasidium sp. 423]
MIRKFFEQARRFTHAPQRGPNCDTEPNETQGNEGHEEGEEIKIRGPLDSYFGEKEPQNERPSKRDRDGLLHTNSLESKKAKTCPRGPRGPYSKQSSMTLWRRKVHAQKHASDIQQFFPTKRSVENVQEHIVVEDEPDLEDIASGSDDRAGSSESTRHRKI